ncbi:ATP-binding protein [Actinomadura rupiterrae]|uniref:ATP-binding protein n=1 Tax=Actinomadura rupiterrae TaxID=559627 RepID=UPI0020A4476C|nr:ATP-binding protein [Actinomadura rupiterrae]MCP2335021.1 anti-sigma regulatory factor (Ser/Thr protein kinase) [Actinomadura rupiterrae]
MGRKKWSSGWAAEWLWSAEEMRWRRTFSGNADQVTAARRFARTLFAGAACAEVVEFAVAELAANTLRHTRSRDEGGWFGVELVYDDPAYVAVTDIGGGGVPAVRQDLEELSEGGRGLYALSQLAISLGIHGSRTLGHTVWADIDLDQPLEAPPGLGLQLTS